MENSEFEKSKAINLADSVNYANHAIVSKTIVKKQTGNISIFSFDEGESLSEHTAPFDAVVQIVEGTAEIIIEGNSHFVKAGEMIIMPANRPHAVKANEQFKMILTMIKSD